MIQVVAALIWDQGRFLACQRPAHKARGLLWEFVGGKVELGESREEALIRECREELGIEIGVQDIYFEVDHIYPDISIHLTLFNCSITNGVPQLLEHNAIYWMHPSEIPNFPFCPADKDILQNILDDHSDKEMAVRIRNMTVDEFDQFRQLSVSGRAEELRDEFRTSKEADAAASQEFDFLLTAGLNTKNHFLMTILQDDCEEVVGYIWTLHEMFNGIKQCFICDFMIWEAKRRMGFATAALNLIEKHAVDAGCKECVLFVRNDNDPASALYRKCGYLILRAKDCGMFMIKQLF